jgi:thiol-disulfide isomerase/thioredoxin
MRITILLLILTSLQLHGQSILNKPAGELEFSKILNSDKTSAKLSDFKSKVVILDFWGTWCAPCIEALPHLESLQNKFSNDLKIITITDESEERINKFLKKRNVSLPIALDNDKKLASAFPYRSVSHTVIIDQNGIIKAVTTPEKINDEILKQVIAGQQINLPEKVDIMNFDQSKPLSGNTNFMYQITITPYQNGLPSMSNPTGGNGVYKGRRILCTNLSPKSLYEIAYQYPISIRTVIEVKDKSKFNWNEQTAICLDLIVPEEIGERRFEIMKQQLNYIYDYKVVIEKGLKKCKVLKPIDGQSITIKSAVGGKKEYGYNGRGLSMKNAEIKTICEFLEGELNVPVIDDTKLTGLYDLELNWYNENPDQIHEELKKLGLQLVSETRDIDVLAIYDK